MLTFKQNQKSDDMAKISKSEALKYHMDGRPGKIEVVPTKPHSTQHDLSLAYTPGWRNLVSKFIKMWMMCTNTLRREILWR